MPAESDGVAPDPLQPEAAAPAAAPAAARAAEGEPGPAIASPAPGATPAPGLEAEGPLDADGLPPDLPADLRAIALVDAGYRRAAVFNYRFRPKPGVDYKWVAQHARDQYAAADAAFKAVDEKAASVITSFGGVAGLLTLGSAVAVASGQVPAAVGIAAGLPFALAAASLIFAAYARDPRPFGSPGGVDDAAWQADAYGDRAGAAEAVFAGRWFEATALLWVAVDAKVWNLTYATWCFVGSIIAVALPFVVGVAMKLDEKKPDAPKPVEIRLLR